MKRIRFVVLSCLMAAAVTAGPAGAGSGPSQQGMDRLKSLAGTWEGKGPGGMPITVTFTAAGEGSAVMEQLSVGQMVTMYHQDGDHIMLTHYCAGNNQPRMRSAGLSADGRSLAFKFHDITNLATPDSPHMKGLTIEFIDADHISEEWTHGGAAAEAPMKLALTRVK